MRCAARACLLGTCILIAIIYFAVHAANSKITETWDENDALARHLLEGSDTGAEKPGGGGGGVPPGNPSVSASVAIVIVISLVSVSLLITGIIIVAVTVDPSSGDDESDIEWDSPRRSNESTELLSDELKDNANFFYAGEIFHEV